MTDETQRIFNLLQTATKAIADSNVWRYFEKLLRGILNIRLTTKYLSLHKSQRQRRVQVWTIG